MIATVPTLLTYTESYAKKTRVINALLKTPSFFLLIYGKLRYQILSFKIYSVYINA